MKKNVLVVVKREAAHILGLSPARVSQLIRAGIPCLVEEGRLIPIEKAIEWYLGTVRIDVTNMDKRAGIEKRLHTWLAEQRAEHLAWIKAQAKGRKRGAGSER